MSKEVFAGLTQPEQAQQLVEQTLGRGPVNVAGVMSGCFNDCVKIETESGLVVLRTPKEPEVRRGHQQSLQEEMNNFAEGVTLFLRTPQQQVEVMKRSTDLGLKTPKCLGIRGEAILLEFVGGVSLDKYVQREPEHIDMDVIKNVLGNLHESHKNGIVIGDRWTRNTHIIEKENYTDHSELDYDFYLRGNKKKTPAMDLAQTLYHLLHFSHVHREFMRDGLLNIYAENPRLLNGYNLQHVRDILIGQTTFFYEKFASEGELYEHFVPPLAEAFELIEGMEEIKCFNSRLIQQGATFYPRNTIPQANVA